MNGKPEVLALLAELLANELTAINQYLLHAKTCEHWGYQRLASRLAEEAAGEREHANKLIERILFLGGQPDLERLHPVHPAASVREMVDADLQMEYRAIAALNAGVELCRSLGDNATDVMLRSILDAEQEDTNWLEAQLELMRQVGEQNYLAQQLH